MGHGAQIVAAFSGKSETQLCNHNQPIPDAANERRPRCEQDSVAIAQAFFSIKQRTITIIPSAAAVNKTLGDIDLTSLTVEVIAVRRRNIRGLSPTNETRLETGDVIVLRGTQEDLAAAEIKLIQG